MIIVDCNNLCYIAYYSTGSLSHLDRPTGIVWGFLRQLLVLAQEFKSSDFVFCWDSRKSFRKRVYPEYKANRNESRTEEEREQISIAHQQFTELRRDVLPYLGFKNNFCITGYEADDLVAHIAKAVYSGPDSIIISTDNDLWQLLTFAQFCYNPVSKKKMTEESFRKKTTLDSSVLWPSVKAIAGCTSDNVKGIERVGEKTAIKFLKGGMNRRTAAYSNISNGWDVINRNMTLVRLPYNDVSFNIQIKPDKLEKKRFVDIFDEYRFEYFLNKFDEWTDAFNL